jgi:hypothetical protein
VVCEPWRLRALVAQLDIYFIDLKVIATKTQRHEGFTKSRNSIVKYFD